MSLRTLHTLTRSTTSSRSRPKWIATCPKYCCGENSTAIASQSLSMMARNTLMIQGSFVASFLENVGFVHLNISKLSKENIKIMKLKS